MHPLFTSSFRKNILSIAFIIAIPAVILLSYVEVGLNGLDTHYLKKRVDFDRQLKSIQILSLGSSNAYYGINPADFSCQGYNLAINAQSMYYDLEFIKKYAARMPNLRLVILPAIFFTTGTELVKTSQDWRIYFYRQYFDIPNETVDGDYTGNIKRFLDSRNYTKIALYSDTLYDHLRDRFRGHVDYTPENSGWYNSSNVPPFNATNHVGPDAAAAHSVTYDSKIAVKNIEYWQEIIDILKKRNVQVLLVHLPEDISYNSNLDRVKEGSFTNSIVELAAKNKIQYADYSKDLRFNSADFTSMPDHLNQVGASKFSKYLDNEYVKQFCK